MRYASSTMQRRSRDMSGAHAASASIGRPRRGQPALKQRRRASTSTRPRLRLRAGAPRPIGRDGCSRQRAERQVRMKRPRVRARRRPRRGGRPPCRCSSMAALSAVDDAEPQDARRAARRKRADARQTRSRTARRECPVPSALDDAAARASATSPRNTSVRCSCSGLTNRSCPAARPSASTAVCCRRDRGRASSVSSIATQRDASIQLELRCRRLTSSDAQRQSHLNSQSICHQLQHHQPQHVQRRLRRLELHHLAAADEPERAHAQRRRRQRPRSRPCRPASPACRRPARRCR